MQSISMATRIFHAAPVSCPHPLLHPEQPLTCSYFYSSAISRMLYKWNYKVCNLWEPAIFTRHNSLVVHPGCWIHISLLLSLIPEYKSTMAHLTIDLLKDIKVASSLGLFWIKQLWTFSTAFHVNVSLHTLSFNWYDTCTEYHTTNFCPIYL